jgi:hypothetical protein
MTTQIKNIIELAANLVIEGKADETNALEMALKIDTEKALKCIDDITDMKRGYINPNNQTQKAYGILLKSVYQRLTA